MRTSVFPLLNSISSYKNMFLSVYCSRSIFSHYLFLSRFKAPLWCQHCSKLWSVSPDWLASFFALLGLLQSHLLSPWWAWPCLVSRLTTQVNEVFNLLHFCRFLVLTPAKLTWILALPVNFSTQHLCSSQSYVIISWYLYLTYWGLASTFSRVESFLEPVSRDLLIAANHRKRTWWMCYVICQPVKLWQDKEAALKVTLLRKRLTKGGNGGRGPFLWPPSSQYYWFILSYCLQLLWAMDQWPFFSALIYRGKHVLSPIIRKRRHDSTYC